MEAVVILLSIIIGLTLVFGGYRLARIVIPLLGFISGLSLGGALAADLSGDVFLGTFLGIFTGTIVGLLFAGLAYLYYYAAVVIMTASLGYWAGSSFILLFGFSPGVLSTLAGISVGVFIGVIAVMANAPKYVLIAFTSLAGAVATIGGVLLLFNQIPLEIYSYTATRVVMSNSFFWTLSALALVALGVASQLSTTKQYEFEEWSFAGDGGDYRPKLPPASTTHTRGV